MNNQQKRENTNDSSRGNDEPKRFRQAARKSTGGPAPRKTLGPKGRKYWYERADGKIKEVEIQTYPSCSDAQQQAGPSTREMACQTDFNSRFYIERSDRIARGEPSPYANSESDY